jgi:hypothetical protein
VVRRSRYCFVQISCGSLLFHGNASAQRTQTFLERYTISLRPPSELVNNRQDYWLNREPKRSSTRNVPLFTTNSNGQPSDLDTPTARSDTLEDQEELDDLTQGILIYPEGTKSVDKSNSKVKLEEYPLPTEYVNKPTTRWHDSEISEPLGPSLKVKTYGPKDVFNSAATSSMLRHYPGHASELGNPDKVKQCFGNVLVVRKKMERIWMLRPLGGC